MNTQLTLGFVTASLHVEYLLPTPLGTPSEVRSSVKVIKGRRVVVKSRLIVKGKVCERGKEVAVQTRENMVPWTVAV